MKINNLMKGIVGGLIFTLLGAFIFQMVANATGYVFDFSALITGGLAGLGFGLFAKERDRFSEHVMGAALGYAAIMLGYFLVYMSPMSVSTGAFIHSTTVTVVPAELMSFGDFMANTFKESPIHALFFVLGIVAGSAVAWYVADKRK
jgi:hypothetical protein